MKQPSGPASHSYIIPGCKMQDFKKRLELKGVSQYKTAMTIAEASSDKAFTSAVGADNPSARTAELFHFLGSDREENIEIIVRQTLTIIGGFFSVYIDTTRTPVIRASSNLPPELIRVILSPPNYFTRCFTRLSPDQEVLVHDGCRDGGLPHGTLAGKYGLGAMIGAAVRKKGVTTGILWVVDNRPRIYASDQIHALRCLASALACQSTAPAGKTEKEEIGEMAGQLAHDLNNVLTGLVSYPELVLMQLDKNSPLIAPISFMHETGVMASDMLQDFLLLARPQTYHPPCLNPADVIRAYFSGTTHARLRQAHPGIRFSMDMDRHTGCIRISQIFLTKLIRTLVSHASAKIRESARVDIIVSPASCPHWNDTGTTIIVRDNGRPVQPEDLSRLFTPFYTKKHMGYPGSGLELAVVNRIMADHGGSVLADSPRGIGLQFTLLFPPATDHGSQRI